MDTPKNIKPSDPSWQKRFTTNLILLFVGIGIVLGGLCWIWIGQCFWSYQTLVVESDAVYQEGAVVFEKYANEKSKLDAQYAAKDKEIRKMSAKASRTQDRGELLTICARYSPIMPRETEDLEAIRSFARGALSGYQSGSIRQRQAHYDDLISKYRKSFTQKANERHQVALNRQGWWFSVLSSLIVLLGGGSMVWIGNRRMQRLTRV